MSGADCCGKTLLVLVNTIFLIIGFVLLAVGVTLKVAWELIEGFVQPLLGSFTSAAGGGSGDAVSKETAEAMNEQLLAVVDVTAWILIGLGLFIVIVGIFGCCGACCSVKCMLISYTVIVLVIFLTKLIVLILLLTATFDVPLKSQFKNLINEKYGGFGDMGVESLTLNLVMSNFQCCGMDSGADFLTATKWKRTYKADSSSAEITLQFPLPCCKTTGTFPAIKLQYEQCPSDPTARNSNKDRGCWDVVNKEIDTFENTAIGAYAGLLGFEVLCAAVAICLVVRSDKRKRKMKDQRFPPYQ